MLEQWGSVYAVTSNNVLQYCDIPGPQVIPGQSQHCSLRRTYETSSAHSITFKLLE